MMQSLKLPPIFTFLDKMRQKPPTLVYFKRESDIERLVEMRMKPGNPIKSKDYHFQCSSSAVCQKKLLQNSTVSCSN